MAENMQAETAAPTEADPLVVLRERMDHRLDVWYRNAEIHPDPELQARRKYMASLVNKLVMRDYIGKMGIPLPRLHAEVTSLDQIDFDTLPDRVVIKPNNASSNDGVLLFAGDRELMHHADVPVAMRREFAEKAFQDAKVMERSNTRIIVEELVQDYDSAFPIPRDFKLYVAGGKIHLIRVIDRNDPSGVRIESYYDADWNFIEEKVRVPCKMSPVYEKPPHFDRLMDWGRQIAEDLGVYYRLDFYISPEGPVFGEFTSYPCAGRGYTRSGAKLICDILDRHPDYL